jgi:hypothetical protein
MTFGALAVWETNSQLAARIIERSVSSITLPMADYLPTEHILRDMVTGITAPALMLCLSVLTKKFFNTKFDGSAVDGILKTPYYMVNMNVLLVLCFNYSDNGSGAGVHPAMFWLASRIGDNNVLYEKRNFLEK